MYKLLNGTNSFASFPLTWVPLQPPQCVAAWWDHQQEYIPAHPQGSWFILPRSELFANTSSWPIMSSSVTLSCGGISLLSRGVVRGGCVAGMPTKPSASPVLPVTSSNFLCLWRMKICKKTFWSTLLLNWTKLCERGSRELHILAFNWCYLARSKNNSQ